MESGSTRFGVISTGEPRLPSCYSSYLEAHNLFLSNSMTKLRPDYSDSPAFVPPHLETTTTYHSMPMSSLSSTIAPVSSRASGRSRWSCLGWPSMFSSSPAAGTSTGACAKSRLSARSLRRDHSIFGDEVCMYLQVQALSDGFASLLLFRWNTHLSRYLRCGGSALAEDLEAVR